MSLKISARDLDKVIKMYRDVQRHKIVKEPADVDQPLSDDAKVIAIINHTENPDYVIRCKYQIEITFQHMNKLRPTNIGLDDNDLYLTDDIIIYMLCLFQDKNNEMQVLHKSNEMQVLRRDLFLYPNFITQLCNKNYVELKKQLNIKETNFGPIKKMGFIYVIVNLTVTHWTMLAVDIQNKTISHYDSIVSSKVNCSKLTKIDAIIKEMVAILETVGIIGHWNIISQAKCPSQINGVDCGPMALLAIERLSKKLPLDYNTEDVATFRFEIARRILNSTSSNLLRLGPSTNFLNYRKHRNSTNRDDTMGIQNTCKEIFDDEEEEEQQQLKRGRKEKHNIEEEL
jgi:Ulp1 family protease